MKQTSKKHTDIKDTFAQGGGWFKRYRLLLFFLIISAVYGFVIFRINTLSSVEPTDGEVTAKVEAGKTPHVDPAIVEKIQQLQDNSVNVQTLFDNARQNPFQE